MPIAPVHRLRKDEIIWLANHRCKHRHTYLEHYACFLEDYPNERRTCSFDIETTNLNATYGITICYCILNHKTGEILHSTITKKDLRNGRLDKRVVRQCVKDLEKFDIVVTYYGTKFDLPFIRTRAVKLNIPFPYYSVLKNLDIYYVVKNKFKLHSNKLAVACEALVGDTEKTIIDPKDHYRP